MDYAQFAQWVQLVNDGETPEITVDTALSLIDVARSTRTPLSVQAVSQLSATIAKSAPAGYTILLDGSGSAYRFIFAKVDQAVHPDLFRSQD